MTYMYPCNRKSCIEKEEGGDIFFHWKSSCCHKCPNPSCRDHGECNCFEQLLEQQRKQMGEMMKSPEYIENILPKIIDNIIKVAEENVKVDKDTRQQSDNMNGASEKKSKHQ
ncbi:MAG: hypothetical protein HOE69_00005 [Euryarchaeota archaeon]|jgi:hypothetical protein|nr:hypothetical protein [Euryarchaeota archaeon]